MPKRARKETAMSNWMPGDSLEWSGAKRKLTDQELHSLVLEQASGVDCYDLVVGQTEDSGRVVGHIEGCHPRVAYLLAQAAPLLLAVRGLEEQLADAARNLRRAIDSVEGPE